MGGVGDLYSAAALPGEVLGNLPESAMVARTHKADELAAERAKGLIP